MDGDQAKAPRAERKRRDVMEAARRRFMADGYAGAGMEGVARDASVSTATVYAYFPSKAELFQAVLIETVEGFQESLQGAETRDGSPRAELTSFARSYASFWSDPSARAMLRVLSGERRRFEDMARELHDLGRRISRGSLIRTLEKFAATGELVVSDVDAAAGQLLGMLEHPTLYPSLLLGDEAPVAYSIERICDEAVETFLARYGRRVHG